MRCAPSSNVVSSHGARQKDPWRLACCASSGCSVHAPPVDFPPLARESPDDTLAHEIDVLPEYIQIF